jgi:hypothetical protein
MGVYELSSAGSVKTQRINYKNMNANNQFGAMVPLGSFTSTGSSGGFVFANIPQTYQDLMAVTYGRGTRAVSTEVALYYINADSGGNYSYTLLIGNGSGVSSSRVTSQGAGVNVGGFTGANATAGVYGAGTMHILNYANTSTFKTIVGRGATDTNGAGDTCLTVGLWRSTAAITQLQVFTYTNLDAGSTITLYGIKASNS